MSDLAKVYEHAFTIVREHMNGFNWGSALVASALLDHAQHFSDRDYLSDVNNFVGDYIHHADVFVDKGGSQWKLGYIYVLQQLIIIAEANDMDLENRDYASAIEVALQYLSTIPRTPAGTISSKWEKPQLWVDSLMCTCPSLLMVAKRQNNSDLFQQASSLFIQYAGKLQDPQSGLFWHAYCEEAQGHLGQLWLRGNAWALMAAVALLHELSQTHEHYSKIKHIFKDLVHGLQDTQNAQGNWSTVLDAADNNEKHYELSGQCLVVAFLKRAQRLGLCEEMTFVDHVIQAAEPLIDQHITERGTLSGVSLGTDVGDVAYYQSVSRADWPLWGTAALLYYCLEQRLQQ